MLLPNNTAKHHDYINQFLPRNNWIHMPDSSHILVTSFLIFQIASFSVRCFPFARQDGQDGMKKKQTIK